jgi:hypothetical protein
MSPGSTSPAGSETKNVLPSSTVSSAAIKSSWLDFRLTEQSGDAFKRYSDIGGLPIRHS